MHPFFNKQQFQKQRQAPFFNKQQFQKQSQTEITKK